MSDKLRDEVIIAIIDLSGSMEGQVFSGMEVMLQDLCAELKDFQRMANNSIRLGVLGFHETTRWIIGPDEVSRISGIPDLDPIYEKGKDDLGRVSCFSEMLDELRKCLTVKFLCKNRTLNSLHMLLFTDGNATDPKDKLDASMKALESNSVFLNDKAKRYVILKRGSQADEFVNEQLLMRFAGKKENLVEIKDFSALLSRISEDLEGIEGLESVFD